MFRIEVRDELDKDRTSLLIRYYLVITFFLSAIGDEVVP